MLVSCPFHFDMHPMSPDPSRWLDFEASGGFEAPWLTIAQDYSLNNPDTLTKYKTAAQISHKVLETVSGSYLADLNPW
jgi:hypothetical protein